MSVRIDDYRGHELLTRAARDGTVVTVESVWAGDQHTSEGWGSRWVLADLQNMRDDGLVHWLVYDEGREEVLETTDVEEALRAVQAGEDEEVVS